MKDGLGLPTEVSPLPLSHLKTKGRLQEGGVPTRTRKGRNNVLQQVTRGGSHEVAMLTFRDYN